MGTRKLLQTIGSNTLRSHSALNKSFKISKLYSCWFLCTTLLLQGCSNFHNYHPLPQSLESQATIPGFKDVRTWGDVPSKELERSAIESLHQEMSANHGKLNKDVNALALSGGGEDGAFGAGIIYGWSKSGKLPHFKIVTGISTGALIAPLVFLSPQYDDKLKSMYTSYSDKDIYTRYSMFAIIFSLANIKPLPSAADTKPLASIIEKTVDQRMLNIIAAEHKKGRRLLIGTTQLNAQRLVIWNMGVIAASKQPGALALFRKVMLASASIPASFPPQYIEVQAGGKKYQEMHVDGGVSAQTMLFENALHPFSQSEIGISGQGRNRRLYIIRNDKVKPEWQDVKPEIKYIAMRSIASLIRSQGIGDFYRLYAFTQRYNTDYNLAFIPPTFNVESKSEFDNHYMKSLFALGYKLGYHGYPWLKEPPGFERTATEISSVINKSNSTSH